MQLLQVKYNGLSGPIEFDEYGFRKNYKLDIIAMTKKSEPQNVSIDTLNTQSACIAMLTLEVLE